jgi:hypothetical protein
MRNLHRRERFGTLDVHRQPVSDEARHSPSEWDSVSRGICFNEWSQDHPTGRPLIPKRCDKSGNRQSEVLTVEFWRNSDKPQDNELRWCDQSNRRADVSISHCWTGDQSIVRRCTLLGDQYTAWLGKPTDCTCFDEQPATHWPTPGADRQYVCDYHSLGLEHSQLSSRKPGLKHRHESDTQTHRLAYSDLA